MLRLNDLWIILFFYLAMLVKELVADLLEATGQAEIHRLPLGQFGIHEFSLH